LLISTTEGPSVPVFTGIWTVELPMLKEPVVALMGAGFLKQGFVNVMATRAFQDSTTRGFDSRLASFHASACCAIVHLIYHLCQSIALRNTRTH
jgi:hypothetical protein